MDAAARRGPFVIVTGGPAWVPMLHRLAQVLPLPAPLLGVQAVPRSGGELAADPQAAVELLFGAAQEALARWPAAQSVLLGGAGLAGLAAPLAARLPCPVLDNLAEALAAAVPLALAAPAADAGPPRRARPLARPVARAGALAGLHLSLARQLRIRSPFADLFPLTPSAPQETR